MKYLLIIIIGLIMVSCELDVKDENVSFEKVRVYNVHLPDEFVVNQEYDISFDYKLKEDCMLFYNVSFDFPAETVREITAFAEVQNTNCDTAYTEHSYSFQFKPMEPGDYTLKFWVNERSDGVDEFEIHEITVLE